MNQVATTEARPATVVVGRLPDCRVDRQGSQGAATSRRWRLGDLELEELTAPEIGQRLFLNFISTDETKFRVILNHHQAATAAALFAAREAAE